MAEQINVPVPQTLYRRVRELARMRKQPVDNVLAEVLDQVLPPSNEPDIPDEETAVERETQAYISLHPTLKEKHLGQHVAIFDGRSFLHIISPSCRQLHPHPRRGQARRCHNRFVPRPILLHRLSDLRRLRRGPEKQQPNRR